MATQRVPKRVRVRAHCSIDGVREGRRMKAGLYEVGKNLTEAERDILLGPQFQHAVEILDDVPVPEPLATDTETPKPEQGFLHLQRKREQEEAERNVRWSK